MSVFVPNMPVTTAPQLVEIMACKCLSTVRSIDQSLAPLQVTMITAVGPPTDLVEEIAGYNTLYTDFLSNTVIQF